MQFIFGTLAKGYKILFCDVNENDSVLKIVQDSCARGVAAFENPYKEAVYTYYIRRIKDNYAFICSKYNYCKGYERSQYYYHTMYDLLPRCKYGESGAIELINIKHISDDDYLKLSENKNENNVRCDELWENVEINVDVLKYLLECIFFDLHALILVDIDDETAFMNVSTMYLFQIYLYLPIHLRVNLKMAIGAVSSASIEHGEYNVVFKQLKFSDETEKDKAVIIDKDCKIISEARKSIPDKVCNFINNLSSFNGDQELDRIFYYYDLMLGMYEERMSYEYTIFIEDFEIFMYADSLINDTSHLILNIVDRYLNFNSNNICEIYPPFINAVNDEIKKILPEPIFDRPDEYLNDDDAMKIKKYTKINGNITNKQLNKCFSKVLNAKYSNSDVDKCITLIKKYENLASDNIIYEKFIELWNHIINTTKSKEPPAKINVKESKTIEAIVPKKVGYSYNDDVNNKHNDLEVQSQPQQCINKVNTSTYDIQSEPVKTEHTSNNTNDKFPSALIKSIKRNKNKQLDKRSLYLPLLIAILTILLIEQIFICIFVTNIFVNIDKYTVIETVDTKSKVFTRDSTADFSIGSTISYVDKSGNTQNRTTDENIIDSGEGWQWYATEVGIYKANTLVLSGVTITVSSEKNNGYGIKLPDNSMIILDNNTTNIINATEIGIRGKEITISGDGRLIINIGDSISSNISY